METGREGATDWETDFDSEGIRRVRAVLQFIEWLDFDHEERWRLIRALKAQTQPIQTEDGRKL